MNFMKKKILLMTQNLKKWKTKFNPENYKAKNFSEEVINAKLKKLLLNKVKKLIS